MPVDTLFYGLYRPFFVGENQKINHENSHLKNKYFIFDSFVAKSRLVSMGTIFCSGEPKFQYISAVGKRCTQFHRLSRIVRQITSALSAAIRKSKK